MPVNPEVTTFLDNLKHPFRQEIEVLRTILLKAHSSLTESIKWNGPNYSTSEGDRITMRIQPPKHIQLIFHRGAKPKEQPKDRLITDSRGLLEWKENDRAVATFRSMSEIRTEEKTLQNLAKAWIQACSEGKD